MGQSVKQLQAGIAAAGDLPLLITEFGSSYKPGGAICQPYCNQTTATTHDTYEASAFLARAMDTFTKPGFETLEVLSYWAISDVFEEEGFPSINASFAGDFGLINPFGVPKPGYRLLQLLHQMGDTRLPLAITRGSPSCALPTQRTARSTCGAACVTSWSPMTSCATAAPSAR